MENCGRFVNWLFLNGHLNKTDTKSRSLAFSRPFVRISVRRILACVAGVRKGRGRELGRGVRLRESYILYDKLTTVFHGLYENPSIRITKTRFYEPARLSTKPLFSLKPLDATTWLRSLLSKVFRSIHSSLSNMDTLWTGTMCKSESGVRLIENKDQCRFLGNCSPTSPLRQH